VVESAVKVLDTDPELFVIVKEPDVTESLKSDVLTVPLTTLVVQYNVVPFVTSVVVTVNVTVDPSFTDVVDGDTEYVGLRDVSLIVTVELVATIVPEVDPVRICN
jgi:hypothetical protein